MDARPLHVIVGAGQAGSALADRLARAGRRVRLVSRRRPEPRPGTETAAADVLDPAALGAAVEGAGIVYHCVNTAYSTRAWARTLPRIQAALVAAAGRAGARLVVLDNLYALGRTGGRPMTEETAASPCSRKGEIRARLAEDLLAAHRRGDVRVVVGRASDFFGPGAEQSHFSGRFWKPVLRGGKAGLLVNPDTPHAYHYLPDVAAGLAALGEAPDDALGRTFLLPCEPAVPTRALIGRFAAALGRPVPLQVWPRPVRRALGLFVPVLRELEEVLYQWDEPFLVDDARFRAAFPHVATTPLDEAARATVAWARGAYGPAAGA